MSSSKNNNIEPCTQTSEPCTPVSSDYASDNDSNNTPAENDLQLSLPKLKCCTGDFKLNCLLGGGIPTGCVTELFGESGTGKTDLCLQLAACAVKPNSVQGSTIYLHTTPFPARRLQALMHRFVGNWSSGINPLTLINLKELESPMDLLEVFHELDGVIQKSYLTSLFPVKLVVIDSIAKFWSPTYTSNKKEMEARVKVFTNMGNKFDQLAIKWDIAIVFTNNVVDVSNCPSIARNNRNFITSGRIVQTGLDVSYGNPENLRVVLTKNKLGDVRHFHVIAPITYGCNVFRITDNGIVGE